MLGRALYTSTVALRRTLDGNRVEFKRLGAVAGLVRLDGLLSREPRARQVPGSRRRGGRSLDGQPTRGEPTREVVLDRRRLRWW